jgi:4-hydroxybenzoate polyprenyltransferase
MIYNIEIFLIIVIIKSILKLIRFDQFVKNAFIFLPLFFAGQITNIVLFSNTLISFSIAASIVYILNDFLDIEDDRLNQ